jgi:hypothetical protein
MKNLRKNQKQILGKGEGTIREVKIGFYVLLANLSE